MSPALEPPDPPADAPTSADVDNLELFRRSPHPYIRHEDEIWKYESPPSNPSSPQSHTPPRPSDHIISDEDGRKRRKTASQSPSESGTEADDEGCNFVKALPAPPLRPHKGLRDTQNAGKGDASPLLTPTQIDEDGRRLSEGFFKDRKKRPRRAESSLSADEAKVARQRYLKRRRNELVRRTTETALLAGISLLAVQGCECWIKMLAWHRGRQHESV